MACLKNVIQQTLHMRFVELTGVNINETLKAWKSIEDEEEEEDTTQEILQLTSEKLRRHSTASTGTTAPPIPGSLLTPGSNNKRKTSIETDGVVDKSDVFNYLLKTVLPLDESWSMDGISDSVVLSIRVLISSMLNQHFQAYIDGDRDAIDELSKKFQTAMVTLSEFLFAQTKITIRRKCIEKQLQTSECLDVETGNISITLKGIPLISKTADESVDIESQQVHQNQQQHQQEQEMNHQELKPYQLKLLKNLIQIFASENRFLENLMLQLRVQGYQATRQPPYEWYIHAMYKLDEETCELDVCFNKHTWQYQFQYQGVSQCPQLTVENERNLYWLSWGVKENDFGYLLGKQVCVLDVS